MINTLTTSVFYQKARKLGYNLMLKIRNRAYKNSDHADYESVLELALYCKPEQWHKGTHGTEQWILGDTDEARQQDTRSAL